MSQSIFLRTALVQTVLVGVLSTLLVVLLGSAFFHHWGWLAGPIAWMACSLITASVLALHRSRTVLGAVGAGILSIPLVIVGVHWLGDVVAIIALSMWCAYGQPLPHAGQVA